MRRLLHIAVCFSLLGSGCALWPDKAHQVVVHNPYPQLKKVAVAPFMNHSAEPTVDGRRFALAYFNELQEVPGFEVVPVGTVEQAMRMHGIKLTGAHSARQLAAVLEVDAVVLGAVTDYEPYYPPRLGLHVEWYAANPCLHEIPPGYGLPFGTPDESKIPEPHVFQAELAVARAQMRRDEAQLGAGPPAAIEPGVLHPSELPPVPPSEPADGFLPTDTSGSVKLTSAVSPVGAVQPFGGPAGCCQTHAGAVMRHTRIYNGHDPEVTSALASYFHFRDDARYGGWQAYLQRSEDFIRFCCHLHIAQMLSVRGGSGETRVVRRWLTDR